MRDDCNTPAEIYPQATPGLILHQGFFFFISDKLSVMTKAVYKAVMANLSTAKNTTCEVKYC